jgi:hypothetical protein
MDLEQMEQSDSSLGKLLKDLRIVFRRWLKA